MPWRVSLTLLILACPALPQPPAGAPHHHPPGGMERWLEDSRRAEWQKPEEVLSALALHPEEVVADIGAGTGYFTRLFAKHSARVYAVDVDSRLLERIASLSLPNVVTVHAAPDAPRLPAASIDTIFFCNVLHHIPNRPAYYEKLRAALKPGGRVVILDFHKRPLPVGPPPARKLAEEEVIQEFEKSGFRLDKKHGFLPYQYFLEFRLR
ncbi:MAG: methyltransferase [Bryobacteraceae bacterium]